jgi:phosphate transport system substrate-binding protein
VAFPYRSLLTVTALLILALVAACSGNGNGTANGNPSSSTGFGVSSHGSIPSAPAAANRTISETGSSLLYRLFTTWAAAYHAKYPSVVIATQDTSSGIGISSASAGQVDIGASDAFLSAGNLVQHPDLLNIPLAISAQQVNYNLPHFASKHLNLDGSVLAEMYTGKITKWNDPQIKRLNPGLSLPDITIVPVHRSESSGDTFLFTSYLSAGNPAWGKNIGYGTSVAWPTNVGRVPPQPGNSGIEADCARIVGCVAYIGISYLHQAQADGLGYAALKNAAGNFVLPTEAGSVLAAADRFVSSIPENESISMVNGPAARGYPIVNYEYAIVPDHYQSPITARDVKAFLHWAITAGNSPTYLGGTIMFQPLPAEVASLADIQIARIG